MDLLFHVRQQYGNKPSLQKLIEKFFNQFKHWIKTYETIPGYEVVDIIQIPNDGQKTPNFLTKIVVIWKNVRKDEQVWWQYAYDRDRTILSMTCYPTINNIVVKANGVYNINLSIKLFQRFNNELNKYKHFSQFNINPATGSMKILNKSFCRQELLIVELSKPNYKIQVLLQMKQMIQLCEKIIQLYKYFNGFLEVCPTLNFGTPKPTKYMKLAPQLFKQLIKTTLTQIDSNCDQDIQNFGSLEQMQQFISSNKTALSEDVIKIIKLFKGEIQQKQIKLPVKISDIIMQIYDSVIQENGAESDQSQKLVKKIKFLGDHQFIQWEPFAKGGFGYLQKAQVRCQFKQLNSKKSPQVFTGYIVRKSDIKRNKIQRQHKIFSLFNTQQHDNIMPHYIPEQPMYKRYIFSKYEPNMSLDRYMKTNRKTIALQTLIKFLEDIVKGLLFLKEHKIVHLDIKPNNVIITKSLKAKITDFGQAFYTQQNALQHRPGFTVPYIPAQVFGFQPYYNSKVDVYSFGVTMYKVLFNTHLWGEILNREKFLQKMARNQIQIKLVPQVVQKYGVSQILRTLTLISLKCVNRQQQMRPTLFYLSVILIFCRFYIYSVVKGPQKVTCC